MSLPPPNTHTQLPVAKFLGILGMSMVALDYNPSTQRLEWEDPKFKAGLILNKT